MIILLAILLLFIRIETAGAANSLGGYVAATAAGPAATIVTGNISPAPTAGSTIAIGIYWERDTSEVISSIQDPAGNSYILVTGSNGEFFTNKNIAIYYAKNITVVGSHTVTVNWTGGVPVNIFVVAAEIKGADQAAPADKGLAAGMNPTTATDNLTTGPVTTVADGEFIFGFTAGNSGGDPINPGTNFTEIHDFGSNGEAEYRIQATQGSIAATWTMITGGGDMACSMATFKAAGAAAPARQRTLTGVGQ